MQHTTSGNMLQIRLKLYDVALEILLWSKPKAALHQQDFQPHQTLKNLWIASYTYTIP